MEIDEHDIGVEGAGKREGSSKGQRTGGAEDQLTLDCGPTGNRYDGKPIFPTFSVSGSLSAKKQLDQGDEVAITISGPDGEVLAISKGRVGVSFKDIESEGMLIGVERKHAAKLID